MIDKDTITEVKQAVNIVDVIGEVVALTKNGRNFLGLCPFHGEKTPSFNVVEDKQFYHCFGCGKSGDVFKFLEDYQGISFLEAVKTVAERANISLALPQTSAQTKQHPHQKLFDIHDEAAKFYHAFLMTTKMGEVARQYLHDRGLTDEVIVHFNLGLSPQASNYLYQKLSASFDEETLLDSGLFNLSEDNQFFDAFQNRIMFPLTDDKGRVLAFSGRIWQESTGNEAKYKNSRATQIFNKSYELYHLDQARPFIQKQHEVYVMEGFMDVIAAHRAGINHAVASMGTALTPEHVKHLAKYTKKIVLAYDGDKAGQAATAKALEILKGYTVDIVRLPQGMDPDEFIKQNSEEKLYVFLSKTRISQVEFLIDYLKPENIDNLQAQIQFLDRLAPIISQEQSLTAQNTYIHKLADVLSEFSYLQVEEVINQARLNQRQAIAQPQAQAATQAVPATRAQVTRRVSDPLQKAECHLLGRMVMFDYVLNDYRLRQDFHFENRELARLFEILKTQGQITSADLAEESEAVQAAWWQVMALDLPDELAATELIEVELSRKRALSKRKAHALSKNVRDKSGSGDDAAALLAFNQLVAQKRKME